MKKIQHYVDQNLVPDCLDMHKEDSRLSSNHLTRLKHLLDDETNTIRRSVLTLCSYCGILSVYRGEGVVVREIDGSRQSGH